MPHEHYCIDDISLAGWLDDSISPTDDIHALVDSLDDIAASGEPLLSPNSLESVPIGKGLRFYDLYSFNFSKCDKQHGVDRDAHSRLIIARGKLIDVEATPALSASLFDETNTLKYSSEESGTAAIVLDAERTNHKFALLTIRSSSQLFDCHSLTSKPELRKQIFVFRNADNRPRYIRWVMNAASVNEEDFFLMWDKAFPMLWKSDNLSFNRLSGNYQTLRPQVIIHLSFLNDGFLAIFDQHKDNMFELTRVAKAQFDIDFSNESPKTRKSKSKMKQRNANFSGKEITCEMHTKLGPISNRIHFHPPIGNMPNGKILVGLFVDHLDI